MAESVKTFAFVYYQYVLDSPSLTEVIATLLQNDSIKSKESTNHISVIFQLLDLGFVNLHTGISGCS